MMPATNTTPGKPVNLTATTDELGAIVVQCNPTPLAMRYRWRMLLVGVETDYRLVARSADPIGNIPGVMPGQKVQIIVQAVNDGLQGMASDPLVFTVPLLGKTKAASVEPLVTATEIPTVQMAPAATDTRTAAACRRWLEPPTG